MTGKLDFPNLACKSLNQMFYDDFDVCITFCITLGTLQHAFCPWWGTGKLNFWKVAVNSLNHLLYDDFDVRNTLCKYRHKCTLLIMSHRKTRLSKNYCVNLNSPVLRWFWCPSSSSKFFAPYKRKHVFSIMGHLETWFSESWKKKLLNLPVLWWFPPL